MKRILIGTSISFIIVAALVLYPTNAFAYNHRDVMENKVGGQMEQNFAMGKSNFFRNFSFTFMNGHQEVPVAGDPNGYGLALVNYFGNYVCTRIKVTNIGLATGAHIHEGQKNVAGPVVVTLPTPDENGEAENCVEVDAQLVESLKTNSKDYYINIHNDEYPDGAIRGQLR